MKKHTAIILALLVISTATFAQSKDSTKKDTIAILHYAEVMELVSYMNMQAGGNVEVKATTWNNLVQGLMSKLQIINIPNKEQPKK